MARAPRELAPCVGHEAWHEVCDTMRSMNRSSLRSTDALATGVAYLFGSEIVYELFDGLVVGAAWRDGRGRSAAAEAIVGRQLVGFAATAESSHPPSAVWEPGLRAVLRAGDRQGAGDDALLCTGPLLEVSACAQTNRTPATRSSAASARASLRRPSARVAPTIPDPSSMTRIHVVARLAPGV